MVLPWVLCTLFSGLFAFMVVFLVLCRMCDLATGLWGDRDIIPWRDVHSPFSTPFSSWDSEHNHTCAQCDFKATGSGTQTKQLAM